MQVLARREPLPVLLQRLADTIRRGMNADATTIRYAPTDATAIVEALIREPIDKGSTHFQPTSLQFTTIDVGNSATNIAPGVVKMRFNTRFNDLWTPETLEADSEPNLTVAPVRKPVPVMVTDVPPIVVPEVGVIDVLVKPGDRVEVDTPLCTLETEKATMDVPSTAAGIVAWEDWVSAPAPADWPARPPRPWLGLYVTEVDGRLIVGGLAPGGPAESAGAQVGDQVIDVGGQPPKSLADLFRSIWSRGPAGSVIELDRAINEPVELIVNGTVVALGEVVVIEGNYGLRVQTITRRDNLLLPGRGGRQA